MVQGGPSVSGAQPLVGGEMQTFLPTRETWPAKGIGPR
jgi:hypothetical protein